MGQYISASVCYGWVIDEFQGQYVNERLDDELRGRDRREVRSETDELLKSIGIEVEVKTFGYDFGGWALVAEGVERRTFSWSEEMDELRPPPGAANDQVRAELQAALDELGWSEMQLGEPKWLLLLGYG